MSVAVRAGAGLAGLAFLAGCQLVLDFSELTDGAVPDGSTPDAGADAANLCPRFEPNELLADAHELDTPEVFRAAICPQSGTPDEDFYSITMDGNQDLNIKLTFEAGENDLELELYHQLSGMKLVVSTGTDGDEQIARTFAAGNRLTAGTYAIRVFGRSAAVQNEYELSWARGPLPETP